MKTTAQIRNNLADANYAIEESIESAQTSSRDFQVLISPLSQPIPWWKKPKQWLTSLFRNRNKTPISLRVRLRIGSDVHFRVRIFGIEVNFVSFSHLHQQRKQEKPLSLVRLDNNLTDKARPR